MKIVQFNDGKYAMRKFSLSHLDYVYRDLKVKCGRVWWSKDQFWFEDCLANSIEAIEARVQQQEEEIKAEREALKEFNEDVGRVVKCSRSTK